MDQYIYCFAIIEYLSIPKILAYYSENNILNINDITNIFSNPNFNIKPGILSSFSHDSKLYFLLASTNSIIFLIVTKSNYPQRLIYDCVKELETNYNLKQNQIKSNNNFLQTFKKLYNKYNNPESIDKLIQVTNKTNQVKNIMHDNINIVLENTIKLETIESKTEALQVSAVIFKSSANDLKNRMWWKNFKMKLIIFSIIAIILTIIISVTVTISKQK